MTVRELKKALDPLDDDLIVIAVAPVEDEDGDEIETWFAPHSVTKALEPDTADEYARIGCGAADEP